MTSKGIGKRSVIEFHFSHSPGLCDVAFHHDGEYILTCGSDTFVRLIKTSNVGEFEQTLDHHQDSVVTLAISPLGDKFCTGTQDHLTSIFNFPSLSFSHIPVRFTLPITCIAFSPTGGYIAVGSEEGIIKISNVDDTSNVRTINNAHDGCVMSVAYDTKEGGRYLTSTGSDGKVNVWDMDSPTPKTVASLPILPRISKDSVPFQRYRVQWSPDSKCFAVAGNKDILIVQRDTWKTTLNLKGHDKPSSIVCWSPNGRYLASAGLDERLFIWDMTKQQDNDIDRFQHTAIIIGLSWNPKSNQLAIIDVVGNFALWEGVIPPNMPNPITNVSVSEMAKSTQLLASLVSDVKKSEDDLSDSESESESENENNENVDEKKDEVKSENSVRRRLRKRVVDEDDIGDNSNNNHNENLEDNGDLFDQMDEDVPKKKFSFKESNEDEDDFKTEKQLQREEKKKKRSKESGSISSLSFKPQSAFQPGSTPSNSKRRFLAFNLIGCIVTRNDGVSSSVEIEFSDATKHRKISFSDHHNFSLASLNDHGAIFGCPITGEDRCIASSVMYVPFSGWAPNSEWNYTLPSGEEVVNLTTVGKNSVVIATNKRFLRVFTSSGVQKSILCVSGDVVCMCGWGDLLCVVYHNGLLYNGQSFDQVLSFDMLNLMDGRCLARGQNLALSPGSLLSWLGFSSHGILTSYDSLGLLRCYVKPWYNSNEGTNLGISLWHPILDFNNVRKSNTDHYWVVGVTDTLAMSVNCKGDSYPIFTIPRPTVTTTPLCVPLLSLETPTSQLEEKVIRETIMFNQMKFWGGEGKGQTSDEIIDFSALDHDNLVKQQAAIETNILRMIQMCCKADKHARALDLSESLTLRKSLLIAIKAASQEKLGVLAEKMSEILFQFDDKVEKEDQKIALKEVKTKMLESFIVNGEKIESVLANGIHHEDNEKREKKEKGKGKSEEKKSKYNYNSDDYNEEGEEEGEEENDENHYEHEEINNEHNQENGKNSHQSDEDLSGKEEGDNAQDDETSKSKAKSKTRTTDTTTKTTRSHTESIPSQTSKVNPFAKGGPKRPVASSGNIFESIDKISNNNGADKNNGSQSKRKGTDSSSSKPTKASKLK